MQTAKSAKVQDKAKCIKLAIVFSAGEEETRTETPVKMKTNKMKEFRKRLIVICLNEKKNNSVVSAFLWEVNNNTNFVVGGHRFSVGLGWVGFEVAAAAPEGLLVCTKRISEEKHC